MRASRAYMNAEKYTPSPEQAILINWSGRTVADARAGRALHQVHYQPPFHGRMSGAGNSPLQKGDQNGSSCFD